MRTPLVTIGMPVYNCESTVAESIASILNQALEDWELVVYDDGSRDDTVGTARQFTDPRIRVVEGGTNRGLPARLNEIVAGTRSPYFARMDADDIAYPHRLEHQLAYLRAYADVDLVGGWMMVFRGNGTAIGMRRTALDHEHICAHPWSGIPIAHPTWVGGTEWFRRNPYRANAVRMEDRELLFRTFRNSRFANLPEVVLGYRENELSLRKTLTARQHTCRMMLPYLREEHSRGAAAWGMAGQVLRSLIDVAAKRTGLSDRLLRQRNSPAPADRVAEWNLVYEEAQATALSSIGPHQAVLA
jgi:glycosyltransferase involved in cell wall biosynthesis